MDLKRAVPSLTAALLAAESFAIWATFSLLPLWSARPRIREAWDTDIYWSAGMPLLLLSVAVAGFASKDAPWKLALWTAAGHSAGVAMVSPGGADFGLLPLALILVGAPAFGVFTGAAFAGRWLRRKMRPGAA